MLWDGGTLLFDDMNDSWSLLNFPRSWDGVHFFHIARHGYSHENVCAFFPLLPLIIRVISWLNDTHMPVVLRVLPSTFLVALFNVVMGGVAAIFLRRITILTLLGADDDEPYSNGKGGRAANTCGTWLDSLPEPISYAQQGLMGKEELKLRLWKEVGATVFMWMLSPTAVFGVVLYTESVFSFATFLGVYMLAISPRGKLKSVAAEAGAVLSFALAGCARSNAIVNAGFVLYPVFLQLFFFDTYRKRHAKRYGEAAQIHRWPGFVQCIVTLFKVIIIVTPYLMLNYFCYTRFVPLWDDASRVAIGSRFWAFYGWIQKRYWNVGFLQSYRWGNVPNVLISAPIVFFTMRGVFLFILRPALVGNEKTDVQTFKKPRKPEDAKAEERRRGEKKRIVSFFAAAESLVQSSNVLCLLVTLLFGVTMAHINVVNRLVMSSPALYWLWGRQFASDPWGGNSVVMIRIFVLWNCIGALFVPNGLPWT